MISIVKDMDKSIEFYRDKMGMKVLDRTDKWTELSFSDQLALALHKVDDEKSFAFRDQSVRTGIDAVDFMETGSSKYHYQFSQHTFHRHNYNIQNTNLYR